MEVAAVVDAMLARVDRDDLRVEARFAQHDANRLRTAAGSVIELHQNLLRETPPFPPRELPSGRMAGRKGVLLTGSFFHGLGSPA